MLAHRRLRMKQLRARQVFMAWQKNYKIWKVEKNKTDFDNAVKNEIQNIAANYQKEIETLRKKLDEAQVIVHNNNESKVSMQDNLKKAFMRGVCALNFEAMNILDTPNGA